MRRKQNSSRLKEIDFSYFNLRESLISPQAEYLRELRDEALFSNWGTSVLIRIPADKDGNILENNVDEYSNFVDIHWIDTTETVIPLFKEYRQVVSDDGMSADGYDGIYSLQIIIPSKLHLPKNSRIILNEYDMKEYKISREWWVLSTEVKQLSDSKTYSRIANCVPARQGTFNNIETALGTIWFDYGTDDLVIHKDTDLRAQGIIWFIRNAIDNTKIKKIIHDEIWEQIPDYPQYFEQVELMMYYDDRPRHIVSGGSGFIVGEEFELKDPDGNTIFIDLTEHGEDVVPLILTVKKVSESGAIEEYKLNTNRGYTKFGRDGNLTVEIGNDNQEKAVIELVSIEWSGDLIQEVLNSAEIIQPKYLKPEENITVFSAKGIAISVLN